MIGGKPNRPHAPPCYCFDCGDVHASEEIATTDLCPWCMRPGCAGNVATCPNRVHTPKQIRGAGLLEWQISSQVHARLRMDDDI